MEETKQPAIVYAEMTPNPATMKFVTEHDLVGEDGKSAEFDDPSKAQGVSPLAEELFQFPFVKQVFIMSNFISIAKNEMVEWDDVTLELREFIRDRLNDGIEVLRYIPEESTESKGSDEGSDKSVDLRNAPASEYDDHIKSLLDEYVRPAVERDGGAIQYHSFQEGTVHVVLKGACSGCPSSIVTLKNGIETLLKQYIPEVNEVEAIEG